MSRKRSKKLKIDPRNAEDIEKRIEELSELYDVGWHMDIEDPDIGTAIARIYARQVEENIGRVNDILERYHTEFVNMLDISLLPAKPASSIVVMDLLTDTIEGAPVPKGTKFLTDTGEPYVFETDHSLFVTSSRIAASFMVDAEEGSFVPLLGSYEKPEIIPKDYLVTDEDELIPESTVDFADTVSGPDEEEQGQSGFRPFVLFGERDGIEQNVIAFFHPTVYDVTGDDIFVRIEDGDKLADYIKKGRAHFGYFGNDGMESAELIGVAKDGCTFVIRTPKEKRTVTVKGKEYQVITLHADGPVSDNLHVKRISFSSRGRLQAPENVNNSLIDLDEHEFAPFSDTLAQYAECFICHDRYFSKAGSLVTVKFTLSFEEHRIMLSFEEEESKLKIIKRKPNDAQQQQVVNCFIQEISIDYYNGKGWKKLPLDSDLRAMFFEPRARQVSFTFRCPDDWESVPVGSFEGRAIRLQILKADNCYMRPALHHYPVIKDLHISFSYEDVYVNAHRAEAIFGTRRFDLTGAISDEDGFMTFRRNEFEEDALYIGLSRRIETGPVSMLFMLSDSSRFSGLKCRFEYRGRDAWKSLKILDYTQDFTRTGSVVFMPPHDIKKQEIEGKSCYWIRVVRSRAAGRAENVTVLPRLENICLNAASVSNVETRPMEQLYVEEVGPGMRFALGAENIFDVDVWVNELGRYSRSVMLSMQEEDPANVRTEFDNQGTITSFFVRWKETERLETSEDPRVYELDRLRNEIIFGDGIHTWIPRVTDDVAIRFSVRCCDGALGNVDAGTITSPQGYLMYVGTIYNPMKAYGGSNIEDMENAMERGASLLGSRNRLVSTDDYLRAIMAFSDTIDQVACVTGITEDGREDFAAVSFVLLMKDYSEGSFAFHRIVGPLNQYLLERCELTVAEDRLFLIEPIFVSISVSVWINVIQMDDSFEIQNILQETLTEYLEPVTGAPGGGWKIGTLPGRSQLMMKLNVLKSRAVVKKAVMIANYRDHLGDHEVDLGDLKVTPFMCCRSGVHQVHISV